MTPLCWLSLLSVSSSSPSPSTLPAVLPHPSTSPVTLDLVGWSSQAVVELAAKRQEEAHEAQEEEAAAAATTTTTTAPGKIVPLANASLPVPDAFPQAFDKTLSLNFTPPCLSFFASFLAPSTPFAGCRPWSFLLPTSSALAALTQADNLTDLAAVLGATLEPTAPPGDGGACEGYMQAMGGELAGRCSEDLANGNAVARQALTGFQTYALMRTASALIDPRSGAYCYLAAVGADAPDDLYLWSLFAGQALPQSSSPTCSPCAQALLATYAPLASNASLALARAYPNAVERTNGRCGSGWAEVVVVVVDDDSANPTTQSSGAARKVRAPSGTQGERRPSWPLVWATTALSLGALVVGL